MNIHKVCYIQKNNCSHAGLLCSLLPQKPVSKFFYTPASEELKCVRLSFTLCKTSNSMTEISLMSNGTFFHMN